MADAALRFGDERFSKRCFGKAVFDFNSSATRFHFAWRSGFQCHAKIVESAGAREAGVNCSSKNIMTIVQQLPGVFDGQKLQKIFRGSTGQRREKPMKMKWTQ